MTYRIHNADILQWAIANRWLIENWQGRFHFIFGDWPYNLESIRRRFGGPSAAPAQYGQDGSFSRQSAGFMGMTWDTGIAYDPATWELLKPLLHPGGFTASFSHTRTQHRLAMAQEQAGFLIEPAIYNYRSGESIQIPAQLGWAYGSGKPTGTNLGKMLDKQAGAERGKKRIQSNGNMQTYGGTNHRPWMDEARRNGYHEVDDDQPITEMAKIWDGFQYGSPLGPEIEPIIIAQKPYESGRLTEDIINTGAGAYNIPNGKAGKASERFPGTLVLHHHPGCRRVGMKRIKNNSGGTSGNESAEVHRNTYGKMNRIPHQAYKDDEGYEMVPDYRCHPDCHVPRLNEQAEAEKAHYFYQADWTWETAMQLATSDPVWYGGKVSPKERNLGCHDLPLRTRNRANPGGWERDPKHAPTLQHNDHPTLKSIALCKWIAGLFLPPPEYAPRRCLIVCGGTGSEAAGALLAGWDEVVMVELTPKYCRFAEGRLAVIAEFMRYGQDDIAQIVEGYYRELGDVEGENQKQLSLLGEGG